MLKFVLKRHGQSTKVSRRKSSNFKDELAQADHQAKIIEPSLSDTVEVNYLRLFPMTGPQITISTVNVENDANLRKDQEMLHKVLIALSIIYTDARVYGESVCCIQQSSPCGFTIQVPSGTDYQSII